MNLDALLLEATDLLDQLSCRWALVGGLALGAHGIARLTSDVDLAVDGTRQDAVVEALAAAGFETLHRSKGYSNHQRGQDRIDLIHVRGSTADQLFGGAVERPGPQGRTVRVVRAEHLAAMKILAMKNDPDRELQELADLREILRLPSIDHDEIAAQFERHGLQETYQALLTRL